MIDLRMAKAPRYDVLAWLVRVVASTVLIAGGAPALVMTVILAGHPGDWASASLMLAGATIGGWLAGRLSPGTTIIEPAVGGALVAFLLPALGALNEWYILPLQGPGASLRAFGLMFAATVLGGLFGGWVGERARRSVGPGAPISRALWVLAVAWSLAGVGLLGGLSLATAGNYIPEDMFVIVMASLGAFGLPISAGLLVGLMAPRPIYLEGCLGALLTMVAAGPWFVIEVAGPDDTGSGIFAVVIVALVAAGSVCAGISLAASFDRSRVFPTQPSESLPRARVNR